MIAVQFYIFRNLYEVNAVQTSTRRDSESQLHSNIKSNFTRWPKKKQSNLHAFVSLEGIVFIIITQYFISLCIYLRP